MNVGNTEDISLNGEIGLGSIGLEGVWALRKKRLNSTWVSANHTYCFQALEPSFGYPKPKKQFYWKDIGNL